MTTRYPTSYNEDWLRAGSPSSFRSESVSALDVNTDLTAFTSAVMASVAVTVQPGDVVTNISFVSGATAGATLSNWWFALYDGSATPALLSQTADQTSAAWAANTVKTLALATPQRFTSAGVVYAAVMVKASTVPTLLGALLPTATAAGAIVGSKVLAQTSGSALTDTAPATIATPTTVAKVPLAILT
jgi:hypothetical protein